MEAITNGHIHFRRPRNLETSIRYSPVGKGVIMRSEEWLRQAEEIMDTASCYNSLEDEVIKLMCLVTRCKANVTQDGEDFLSRKYMLEKVTRILQGIPIILDCDGQRMYASIKMQQKETTTSKEDQE